jgi:hypothetical protein
MFESCWAHPSTCPSPLWPSIPGIDLRDVCRTLPTDHPLPARDWFEDFGACLHRGSARCRRPDGPNEVADPFERRPACLQQALRLFDDFTQRSRRALEMQRHFQRGERGDRHLQARTRGRVPALLQIQPAVPVLDGRFEEPVRNVTRQL